MLGAARIWGLERWCWVKARARARAFGMYVMGAHGEGVCCFADFVNVEQASYLVACAPCKTNACGPSTPSLFRTDLGIFKLGPLHCLRPQRLTPINTLPAHTIDNLLALYSCVRNFLAKVN